jgi:C4-dicarboxylate-specific signal transduction histidine kinase
VLALATNFLRKDQIVVRLELADDLPSPFGDRVQLQQVILNLIRNAADAMADVHDRPRHLLVKTELDDQDMLRLAVRDVGIGLSQKPLDSLFDEFRTTKSSGMGIGLFASRSIIERQCSLTWEFIAASQSGAPASELPSWWIATPERVTTCTTFPAASREKTPSTLWAPGVLGARTQWSPSS